jgi:hypothetical protein
MVVAMEPFRLPTEERSHVRQVAAKLDDEEVRQVTEGKAS